MRRDPSLIPLSHQHHNGLALCVLTRRSLASDTSEANRQLLARRIVDRYELELANHFDLEEKLVFPAIHNDLGGHPLIAALIDEHRALERFVEEFRGTAPEPAQLEEFCALLESHIRREERELFEDVQGQLSDSTKAFLENELNTRAVRICL